MSSPFCLYSRPLSTIHSFIEMVDFASKYNISQIEPINTFEFRNPDFDFALKLKEYADTKNIAFPCFSVGLNLVNDDYLKSIDTVKKYVDIAALLGSRYFHHTIALEFKDPEIVKQNWDLYYQRGLLAVRAIFDYAKQYSIQTVYEDQGFLFNGISNFKQFLSDVDRNVGVVADFGNIHFVDESIPEFINTFSDRIVHVHVKDYIITSGVERIQPSCELQTIGGNYLLDCPLGQGNVPITEAFQRLKAISYTGSISLEAPPLGTDEEKIFCENFKYINTCIKNYL